jgi:apolipoprotein N-acyltransferase
MSRMTRRFHVEVVLAALSAFLFVIALIWKDWIEIVFGVDPDRGRGALEWAIVAAMAIAALTCAALARWEWKRVHMSTE